MTVVIGSNDEPAATHEGEETSSEQSPFEQNGKHTPEKENKDAESDVEEVIEDNSFPLEELDKLEEMINRSRWVVPVLPNGELEILLKAALRLARNGSDEDCDHCKRFIKDGLVTSFMKILTDDAVSGWKFEIHRCIYHNCELLIELCVLKLNSNCQPVLDMLALVFNPDNKFHQFNASRGMENQDTLYAKINDTRSPKGWLVNLINRFGIQGGFDILLKRFEQTTTDHPMPLGVIVSLVKPFGQCCQYLTKQTVNTYLMPIVEKVPIYLKKLSDEQLKKDTKNDSLSLLVKWLRYIAECAGQTYTVDLLEEFRLHMLLKLLQISSFNGKMNALNEVNKAITNVLLYRQSGHTTQRADSGESQEYLTSHKMVGWIRDNNVLSIVLRDSLHQPQYVEKLEKIIRFMIKEKALGVEDLNAIWDSQSGATRHEAIVKNIHDLLAKLAWDFSPDQLEHVFESCFKKSWATASTKKEREKLIELIRRLAEDDKDGMMAHKVLQLLWGLAHNQQVPNEIVDLALAAHLKILDFSCCQDRSAQKQHWLEECVKELKTNDKWVIPALKHIRDICMLYQENQQSQHGLTRGANQGPARSDIISTLQNRHTLVVLVTTNLVEYVDESKKYLATHPDPSVAREGHRYSHNVNVHDRLRFLRFLLKDGQLWLCAPQATQIWKCLAENGAYPSDREACFNWFAKLMGDEPDLDPDINKQFFEDNILKFDPAQLTDSGIHCFQRFFKMVNIKEGNLVMVKSMTSSQTGLVYSESVEFVGCDYLWKVVLLAPDAVSAKAAEILRTTNTNLGPKLQESRMELHEEFVNTCFERIRMAYDTWKCLQPSEREPELRKMCRILGLLTQYVQQCDSDCHDRLYLPLCRALRGKEMQVNVQLCLNSTNEKITVSSHTHETLFSLKRQLEQKLDKGKIELFYQDESLVEKLYQCMGEIFSTLKVNLKAKVVVNSSTALHLTNTSTTVALQSSPASTSSSESESPSPPQLSQTSQLLLENHLPGVLISRSESSVKFSLTLCDIPELYDVTWTLLQQIPASSDVIRQVQKLAAKDAGNLAGYFASLGSQAESQYYLEVLYSLLLPANNSSSADNLQFQCTCIKSGILHSLVDRLVEAARLPYSVQLVLLKLYRFLLSILISNKKTAKNVKAHEDSVVCLIAERIVAELQHQGHQIQDLSNSVVEAILWNLIKSSWDITNRPDISDGDVQICEESLYTLTASLRFLNDEKINSKVLKKTDYIFYLLLKCPNAAVRLAAEEVFYKIGMQFDPLNWINSLYSQVNDDVVTHYETSSEYFSLIGWLFSTMESYSDAKALFEKELAWLHAVRQKARPPQLTKGHLIIAINVCKFLSIDEKVSHKAFVKELLEDFIFPASKTFVELKNPELIQADNSNQNRIEVSTDRLINGIQRMSLDNPEVDSANSVCITKDLTNAALDLVVELCNQCYVNLQEAIRILNYMFYSDESARLTEWEFLPAVGPRPSNGFVGLKNAGATCYMNSVLQQLYMITPIRHGLLSLSDVIRESDLVNTEPDNDYNVGVLKQVMIIFGFLEKSRQQFYVPQGFWNHFRLWGEPVNVREQHDALEFFNCLVDSIDEALKSLNKPTILNKVLGGTFADQKICKGCPHRYSCEEGFTTLNIDIRNHSNLLDSLEQYVKGDLLEGPNAYHCEQCNKKVDTVKRLCIKSLPPILAIQLKRFDYDWDRECAIKFNDYFEFPRQLDMEPYTVQGLARREGESIEGEKDDTDDELSTQYELSGIVVHSGQASGGHYYSYIKTDGKWYKFDDGEVCESKMDTHEEMKNQCFGGDYTSDFFDQISKKMACRRQKRWWNAYILFYHRVDVSANQNSVVGDVQPQIKLPPAIEMSVWQQNLQYTHIHDQFTQEFFRFVKGLVSVNKEHISREAENEEENSQNLACLSMELARKFLFSTYFHTKKSLRGNMTEWLSTLVEFLYNSKKARTWFARSLSPQIVRTYLLESSVDEVRHFFAHLLATLCSCLLKDSPSDSEINPLSQLILTDVIQLLNKDIGEYGRHVNHYFLFYSLYAETGDRAKLHLLNNEVPLIFIRLALDEGAIKYQYAELNKLYQTLATLLHCLDVTPYQVPVPYAKNEMQPNPYTKTVLAPMPNSIVEYLYQQSNFIKKLIEDANGMEDVLDDLLKYLCWENATMSQNVITELLWFTTYVCTYEIRPFLDILLHILCIKDSWQKTRIDRALKSVRSGREGLFDIIDRSKNHYQKRAYQCVKLMVELFYRVPEAISKNTEMRRRFRAAVEWTRSELERKHYSNQPWSQVSNETSNGYFLERSASAADMIYRACHLLTEFDDEEEPVEEPVEEAGDVVQTETAAEEYRSESEVSKSVDDFLTKHR